MYEHNVCTICMNKMYDKYPLFFSGNERSTPCRRACPPSNCRPPCCSTLLAASGTRAPGWWLLILMWPWCVKMLGSRNLSLLMLNWIVLFVKLVTCICQNCDMDFFKVVTCISRPLPNKTKLKFDQDFKACWSFCFELEVLKSNDSMPWVRCAFGNIQGGFFNWSALKMTKCQNTCKFLQKKF